MLSTYRLIGLDAVNSQQVLECFKLTNANAGASSVFKPLSLEMLAPMQGQGILLELFDVFKLHMTKQLDLCVLHYIKHQRNQAGNSTQFSRSYLMINSDTRVAK